MSRYEVNVQQQIVEQYKVTVDAATEEQARNFVELKLREFDLEESDLPLVLDTVIEITNGREQPDFDEEYVADYIEEYGDQ